MAKETCEEAAFLAGPFLSVRVAGAALIARHVSHDLFDVLAAPGPGGFLAFAALSCSAHVVIPSVRSLSMEARLPRGT